MWTVTLLIKGESLWDMQRQVSEENELSQVIAVSENYISRHALRSAEETG